MKQLCKIILALTLAASASRAQQLAPVQLKEELWYQNSIIYNLEVGVFQDSDGDGRGDFQGLIQKLDYLKALGVDAIWLAPFQPSPGKDDGYDVADFYGVDPKLGTSGDFAELVFQAKKRGLKVIMDLVINHTSDQHPWFVNALKGKDAKYRDWYIWSDKLPKDYNKGMVFPGVQTAVWKLDQASGQYYYHRFYDFQPDLNYSNPLVVKECQNIIGYWLGQGIDGFRLDAVPFIIEVPNTGSEKPKLDFNFLTNIRQFAQSRRGDVAILGEANVPPEENQNYFGKNGEGIQMMFNFFANQYLFYALATQDLAPFKKAITQTQTIPEASQWAHFLRNHDEIDLGRLSETQRKQVYAKFGPDTSMQLYDRGIRRRLATMLAGNRKHIELAYSLLFSLPGTAVIRYGDELGMGDDLRLKERVAVRTPMQWNANKNAGFTTADTSFRPVIDFGEFSYQNINVETQQKDPFSLLNWTKDIIKLRKTCPEISVGKYKILDTGSSQVLGIQYEHEGKSVVILHNFSSESSRAVITLKNNQKLTDLIQNKDKKASEGKQIIMLDGYGYAWYRIL